MTADSGKIDIEAALVNPSAFFAQPKDIARHPDLPHEIKVELLQQWERDARSLAVAEEEGMTGGEESMLGRVRHAIQALGEGESTLTGSSTKHGG
jgi:hypothetical protein